MKRQRVLVTGTGQFGVGEGIVQCLNLAPGQPYSVIAANVDVNAVSLLASDSGVLLPPAKDSDYLDHVLQACKARDVRFLIPGSEPELKVLAGRDEEFESIGCTLLANPADVVAIGDDKFATYDFLSRHSIPTPRSSREVSASAARELGWPVVLKPYSGGGSRNVHVAQSLEELEALRRVMQVRGIRVFLQEHIGREDVEFTASALMAPDGSLIGSFAARRTLAGGASATVEVQDFPEVRAVAEQVAKLLHATGPINIQARIHDGYVSVFEINTRFSGSAPFRALCGFNEPHLLIQKVLGGHTELPERRLGMFGIRYFGHSIFPMDRLNQIDRGAR